MLAAARSRRPARTRPALRRFARVVCVPVLAVAALAACGSDDADSVADVAAASDDAAGPLDFTAPLVGGGTFDGTAYGERPVVLWFWAPG